MNVIAPFVLLTVITQVFPAATVPVGPHFTVAVDVAGTVLVNTTGASGGTVVSPALLQSLEMPGVVVAG